MKKLCLLFLLLSCAGNSQTVNDLFHESDVKITWLGIDFSHVKLIGDFAEFFEAGEKVVLADPGYLLSQVESHHPERT